MRWSNSTLRLVWWSVGAVLRFPLEVNVKVKGGYHGCVCNVGQTQHGDALLLFADSLNLLSLYANITIHMQAACGGIIVKILQL
jgi:hypothetical protein